MAWIDVTSAAYIKAADPKIQAFGPAFSSLADAAKGTPSEAATNNANELTKSLLGEYVQFKDKPLTAITDEDKTRIQAEEAKIPETSAAIKDLMANQDSQPAPVKAQLASLQTAMDDMKAYGRGGLRPCFRDIGTLRTAAQNSGLQPPAPAQRQVMAMYLGFDGWLADVQETTA